MALEINIIIIVAIIKDLNIYLHVSFQVVSTLWYKSEWHLVKNWCGGLAIVIAQYNIQNRDVALCQ